MAAQALYRRYRSQTFGELIGQEHVIQTLRNALADGRIAHAYLFTGPRGVGKTSVARLLAKAVNCEAPLPERPCGQCAMCTAIADGRAVDVIEMDAASHTSVEDAREIIERVQFRPTIGQYKVYIIDEVHMLSTAAFNALLKTLEEPPGHALFILATTEVHKVPATILSRCQKFVFSRHSVAATTTYLRSIAEHEHVRLESGVAEAIARAATGSMRDALSVLDQLMAYGSGMITLEQVRQLLGASESQEVTGLIEALIGADLPGALGVIAEVMARGADVRQFTRDLVERLRAVMLLKSGADRALLDVTDEELAELERQAMQADLGALINWVRLFSELDHQLRTSSYGQLPLELAIVEALTLPAVPHRVAPAAPTTAPRQAAPPARTATPSRAAAPPAPVVREPEPTPVAPEPVVARAPKAPAPKPAAAILLPQPDIAAANADFATLDRLEQVWPQIVRDVRVEDKNLQALLNSGVRPTDVRDGHVVLEVDNQFLLSKLDKPASRHTLERVIARIIGIEYRVRCTVKEQEREHPSSMREQIRQSRRDPLVKAAINIFDADIIAVDPDQT